MRALGLLGLLAVGACLSKPAPPTDQPTDGGNPNDGAMVDTPPPSGGFVKLSVGDNHACAIDGKQRLYCWGRADTGALGNLLDSTSVPTLVSTETGWTDVAAAELHTCGILNGKARCWGTNSVAQTDQGTIADDLDLGAFTPVSIFAHDGGSCALDAAGKIVCWGQPAATAGDPMPYAVGGDTSLRFTQVAIDDDHACALTTDGAAYCWGSNAVQQLGTNATGKVLPGEALAISGKTFRQLAVGGITTCGIRKTDQAIECWGDLTAPMVPGGTAVVDATRAWTAIAMGNDVMCGIAANQLRCWGYSDFGQAAAGITDVQPIATTPALENAASVAIGDEFGCALTIDNQVSCWGQNRYGNVGNGEIARSQMPIEIFSSAAAQYVSVGGNHACLVVEGSGDTYCWGDNRNHEVGPTDSVKFHPTPTELTQKLALVSAGRYHTCGILLANSHAFCWGNNDNHQLGGGSSSTTMVEIPTLQFTWLSAGDFGTCGVAGGKVYCWGTVNGVEQPSTTMPQPLPMAVYTQVMLADGHAVATDGMKVWGFGNACASTGLDGPDIMVDLAPEVAVPSPSSPGIELAVGLTGGSDSCAMVYPHKLFCWGKNEQSELSTTDTGCLLPFERTSDDASLGGPDPAHPGGKLVMADDHGCLLSTDSNAVCWGDDAEYQIGPRSDISTGAQLLVPFPTAPYSYLALGNTIGCGIHSNDGTGKLGHVECWGTSPFGELGNGTMFVGTPTRVSQ